MECREALRRLREFVSGELAAETEAALRAHVRGCRECRRAWAALDPVGATAAYGQPPAPAGLRDAVLAAVAALPAVRPAPRGRIGATTVTAAAGVVALWAAGLWAAPAAAAWLASWTHAALTDGTVLAAVARALLAQVTPALAAAVVAAEAAAAYGLTRLAR